MDELDKILAASKAQAAAGTERIAFDPMALAYAIEQGIAARVAAEREKCAAIAETSHPHDWAFIGAAIRNGGPNAELNGGRRPSV